MFKKPAALKVADVFPNFAHVFTSELAAQPYDKSDKILSEITKAVAAANAMEVAYDTGAPTASYVVKKQKQFTSAWWTYLSENIVDGPKPDNMVLRKALDLDIKQVFDAVFFKLLSGKDLPQTKDGFQHNALQALRELTRHGDAAIFLYRVRYWWPKATIVRGGRKWIAKTHKQWAKELGMEERSFRTAYNHLVKLNLIEATVAPFHGQTMNHIRPTEVTEKLFSQLKAK